MRKLVALVAACDRNNYGDVLLPILFEEFYRKNGLGKAEFDYFGLSKSDLSDIGGKKTLPLHSLDDRYSCVILAGGDVLAVNYTGMYLNLQKNKLKIFFFQKILPRLDSNFEEKLCKFLLRGKNSNPWSIFPGNTNQKIFYNGVGGICANEKTNEETCEVIEKSQMFSVRDRRTFFKFKESGIKSKIQLIPDTAMIMSEIYPPATLCSMASGDIRDWVHRNESYYVVQMKHRVAVPVVVDAIDAINHIYEKQNLKCVLLPIGRAQGHEDDLILSYIKEKAIKGSCFYVDKNTIYDIMYLISRARCYLGTSLHGAITAASYCVPHSLITYDRKTANYLRTWQSTSIICMDSTEDIIDFVTMPDIRKTLIETNIKSEISLVKDYLKKVVDCIDID